VPGIQNSLPEGGELGFEQIRTPGMKPDGTPGYVGSVDMVVEPVPAGAGGSFVEVEEATGMVAQHFVRGPTKPIAPCGAECAGQLILDYVFDAGHGDKIFLAANRVATLRSLFGG